MRWISLPKLVTAISSARAKSRISRGLIEMPSFRLGLKASRRRGRAVGAGDPGAAAISMPGRLVSAVTGDVSTESCPNFAVCLYMLNTCLGGKNLQACACTQGNARGALQRNTHY